MAKTELGGHDMGGLFERYWAGVEQRGGRVLLPVGRWQRHRILRAHAMLDDHAREDHPAGVAAALAGGSSFPGHERRAGSIVERVGRQARQSLMLRLGGN